MLKKLTCAAVFSLLAFTIPGRGQASLQSSAQDGREIEIKVDAYVKPYIDIGGFSGSILIARGGRVLLSKGYGMANYELSVPNTSRTKFHIASVSKTFTAAAIMILAERGRLSVHDPLSKFIPDYPNGDKIIIQHLLTHTSGIPNINNLPDYNNQSRFPHTPEELIAMFKHRPLDFNPGEKYSYSNSNYNVLAYIIEKASGKSYGDFLKENIFDPLDMKDTGHDGHAEALLENRASGYVPVGVSDLESAPYLDWTMKTGNGSLYSTVEDLYRWDRALYTEKIIKRSGLAEMFTPHVNNSVGYGWFIGNRFNRKVVRMNGRSPGFQSEIQRYINDDVCVIVLGNNYAPTSSLIADDLAAIVFGEKYEIPVIAKPRKVDGKTLEAYAGRYRFGPDFFSPGATATIEKNNNLLVMKWSTGANVSLVPQSETQFFDRTFWANVTFMKDSKGEITHLIWRYGGSDYRADKIKDN